MCSLGSLLEQCVIVLVYGIIAGHYLMARLGDNDDYLDNNETEQKAFGT